MSEIKSELVLQFREWIFTNTRPEYVIKDVNKELIEIETKAATGYIRFYEMNIVELSIESKKTKEIIFYIHFQVNDMDHAKELFNEMMETLVKADEDSHVRVLLCCTSALTTSFFAQKLNESAQVLSLNYSFNAVSYDLVFTEGLKYDVILLAPQAGYLEKKVKEAMANKPVMTIPAAIYGKYDTGALIELVKKIIDEKKPKETAAEKVSRAFNNLRKILVICVFNSARHIMIRYRYYKNGSLETESNVVKPDIRFNDIFDILDTMTALHPEIECVGLTMPGTAMKGRLYLPSQGINNDDIAHEISERYHVLCVLSNDANAVVSGIYSLQDHYQNIVFHYQPYGYKVGGEGIIANGQLVKGMNNRAGEVKEIIPLLKYDYPEDQLGRTPDATYNLLSRELAVVNTLLAPEAIFVYSSMAPEIDILKKELQKYISEEEMPDLYYIDSLNEYMMVGTMLKCLEWLNR